MLFEEAWKHVRTGGRVARECWPENWSMGIGILNHNPDTTSVQLCNYIIDECIDVMITSDDLLAKDWVIKDI